MKNFRGPGHPRNFITTNHKQSLVIADAFVAVVQTVKEVLVYKRDPWNTSDRCAMAVCTKHGAVIRHLPRNVLGVTYSFAFVVTVLSLEGECSVLQSRVDSLQ